MPNIEYLKSKQIPEYDLFQVLRVLERSAIAGNQKTSKSIGVDEPPKHEFVAFGLSKSIGFEAAPVERVEALGEGELKRTKLYIACFGLLGSSGVLPTFYTDLIVHKARAKDSALEQLITELNARSISFSYRAWQKNRLPISWERRNLMERLQEKDISESVLGAYTGIRLTHGEIKATEQLKSLVYYYSGFYSNRPRNAYSLKRIAQTALGVDVTLIQNVGRWFSLDENQITALGGENSHAGTSFTLGDSVYEGHNSFRIKTEPLDLENFESLLPGSDRFQFLKEMVSLYVGDSYLADLQLVLMDKEVPEMTLFNEGDERKSSPLGTGLWLESETRDDDAQDAIFELIG